MNDYEAVCRQVYVETRELFRETQSKLATPGFRVLYGPPYLGAPYLFIGYQPGGRQTLEQWTELGFHESWPDRCDYAHAKWPLAKRLQDVFGAALLDRCVGTNAVFFRAPSVKDWKADTEAAALRKALIEFSLDRVERITRAVQPNRIVVIGIGTSDLLKVSGETALKSHRTLVRRGELWGIPAYGIIHLSGARVKRNEIEALRQYFSAEILN